MTFSLDNTDLTSDNAFIHHVMRYSLYSCELCFTRFTALISFCRCLFKMLT